MQFNKLALTLALSTLLAAPVFAAIDPLKAATEAAEKAATDAAKAAADAAKDKAVTTATDAAKDAKDKAEKAVTDAVKPATDAADTAKAAAKDAQDVAKDAKDKAEAATDVAKDAKDKAEKAVDTGKAAATGAAAAATGAATAAATTATATAKSIVGKYNSVSTYTYPKPQEFKGSAEIAVHSKAPNLYSLTWKNELGDAEGIGLLNNNLLVVSSFAKGKGEECGFSTLVVGGDGKAQEVWGDGSMWTSTATPEKVGKTAAGNYKITGKTDEGETYNDTMKITEFGKGFKVVYQDSEGESTDFGIQHKDVFAVGWNTEGDCAVAIYEMKADGSLEGHFSQGSPVLKDGEAVAKEVLTLAK